MELITQEEAALIAGVSERTIRRWAFYGVLTGHERRMPSGQVSVMVDRVELELRRVPSAPDSTTAPASSGSSTRGRPAHQSGSGVEEPAGDQRDQD